MRFWFTIVALCLGVMGCDEKKERLVVGTSADYPPFEFYKHGEIVGFEIDLIHALAKELKKNIYIKDLPFDSLIGALQSGRVDVVISSLAATDDRRERVDFTVPYYQSISVLLVGNYSDITDIQDLSGKTVGVQMGSTYEKTARDEWKPIVKGLSLRSLSRLPDLIQDFKSNRIQAIVVGKSEGESVLKSHPNFRIIPLPSTEVFLSIALPKNSPLTEKVNQILEKWKTDGTLEKIGKLWFSEPS